MALSQFKDPTWTGDGVSPKILSMINYAKKHHALGRNTSYASCWHLNDNESAATWRLYLQAAEGIAIRSTVDRFCRCFVGEESVEIGSVVYEDFQKLRIPLFGNVLSPSFIKRKSFEHEHEVRALYWHTSDFSAGMSSIQSGMIPPKRAGFLIKVELEVLVDSVYVSPTCPSWFGDLVRAMLKKSGLSSIQVVSSDLASRPVL